MPRDQRNQEARQLRSRVDTYRKQTASADYFLTRDAAHRAGLHLGQDPATSLVRIGPEDAAIHVRTYRGRCVDDGITFADRSGTRFATSIDGACPTAFDLPGRGQGRTAHDGLGLL